MFLAEWLRPKEYLLNELKLSEIDITTLKLFGILYEYQSDFFLKEGVSFVERFPAYVRDVLAHFYSIGGISDSRGND